MGLGCCFNEPPREYPPGGERDDYGLSAHFVVFPSLEYPLSHLRLSLPEPRLLRLLLLLLFLLLTLPLLLLLLLLLFLLLVSTVEISMWVAQKGGGAAGGRCAHTWCEYLRVRMLRV